MWKLLGFLGFWTKTHKDNGSKCQPWGYLMPTSTVHVLYEVAGEKTGHAATIVADYSAGGTKVRNIVMLCSYLQYYVWAARVCCGKISLIYIITFRNRLKFYSDLRSTFRDGTFLLPVRQSATSWLLDKNINEVILLRADIQYKKHLCTYA